VKESEMSRKRNAVRFVVERNTQPWDPAGLWVRWAACEFQGEACLIAKLLNDHHSANGRHDDEQTRVVDTETGLLVMNVTSAKPAEVAC
jgi:hypothetical protein